jgi:hypothetical protein
MGSLFRTSQTDVLNTASDTFRLDVWVCGVRVKMRVGVSLPKQFKRRLVREQARVAGFAVPGVSEAAEVCW